MADKKIRLQKFMAQAGVASRRKAEEMILAGRVSINGRTVRELGTKVDPRLERVQVDKRQLHAQDLVWLVMNKPKETMCTTNDPEGRKTIMDLIKDQHQRLYPVGRLDYHTEGVLLLTNDGDLAQALLHPKNQFPRIYHVKLKGIVNPEKLDPLRQGVTLDTGENVKAQMGIRNTTG
ncbi:MAG: pseudouridine synthase, partial [Pseudomonadota bacterium]